MGLAWPSGESSRKTRRTGKDRQSSSRRSSPESRPLPPSAGGAQQEIERDGAEDDELPGQEFPDPARLESRVCRRCRKRRAMLEAPEEVRQQRQNHQSGDDGERRPGDAAPALLREGQIERDGEGEEQHGLAAQSAQPRGQAAEESPADPAAPAQAQQRIEAGRPEEHERRIGAEPHRAQRHPRQGGIDQHRPGTETPAPQRDARAAQKHGGCRLEQWTHRPGAGLPWPAEAAAGGGQPDRQGRGGPLAPGSIAPGQAAAPEPARGLRRIELQRRDPQEGQPQNRQGDDDVERHLPEAEPGFIGRPRLPGDGGIRLLSSAPPATAPQVSAPQVSAPRARRGRGHLHPARRAAP